jgi:hypothetical protein
MPERSQFSASASPQDPLLQEASKLQVNFANMDRRSGAEKPGPHAFTSPPTGLLIGQIGYRFDNGWRIQLDAFNLTNSRSGQITYAYGSLLKSDALFAQCAANISRRRLFDRRDGPGVASGRAACRPPHRGGAVLAFDLTCFLYANRYPLRSKTL